MLRALAFVLALLPAIAACATPASSAPEEGPRELVVLLAPGAEGLESRLREESFFRWWAPRLENWRVTMRAAEAGEDGAVAVAPSDASVHVLLLPGDEPPRGYLGDVPVGFRRDRVGLAGAWYDARKVSLAARLPGDGDHWVVASADPDGLVGAVNRVLTRAAGVHFVGEDPALRYDYEVRANPWLQRLGAWRRTDDGWAPDPSSERDGLADRERWLASLRPIDVGAVRLLVPPAEEDSAAMRDLASDLGRTAEAVAPAIPLDSASLHRRPVTVVVEADFVAQIRHTGALGTAVPGWTRVRVSSDDAPEPPDLDLVYQPDDVWAYRQAVARHLLERARAVAAAPPPMVEGAALWLAGKAPGGSAGLWFGRPYAGWLPDLVAADVLPDPRQLGFGVEPEAVPGRRRRGDVSEPLWTPVAAAVVAGLPGRTAKEKLAAANEAAVSARIAAIAASSRAASAPARSHRAALPKGVIRGVSLAASLGLETAYHAPGLDQRLDRLSAIGANSVSLMPFASQRAPDEPGLLFFGGSPTSETDTGLVHAARTAHRHGFTVLWKPHLWVHGSWPGEIAMRSDDDWTTWWRDYRHYVLHHAMLASYAGAEMFCVGVELERTVERRADWLALISAVRRFFPGAVTYAANWGSGADRVAFWDALDAAGVDAYYPLSESAEAGPRELRRGAEEVARRLEAVARRADRPLLLTEVGFPAQRGAWLHPHEEGGEVSDADQAAAYRALLGELEDRPWLRGVYLWKVFSGSDRFGVGQADFRFLGRPSEEVVAGFFRRLSGEGSAAPGRP